MCYYRGEYINIQHLGITLFFFFFLYLYITSHFRFHCTVTHLLPLICLLFFLLNVETCHDTRAWSLLYFRSRWGNDDSISFSSSIRKVKPPTNHHHQQQKQRKEAHEDGVDGKTGSLRGAYKRMYAVCQSAEERAMWWRWLGKNNDIDLHSSLVSITSWFALPPPPESFSTSSRVLGMTSSSSKSSQFSDKDR